MFSDPRKGGESLLDQALKTRYDRLENFQLAKTRAAPTNNTCIQIEVLT